MSTPDLGSLLRGALAAHQAGRHEEAAQRYRACLQRDPQCLPALYYSGMLALQRQRPKEAVNLLGRLSALDAHKADVWYHLGLAHERCNARSEAQHAYRQALALEGGHRRAANNLALLLHAAGDDGAARSVAHAALTVEPNDAELLATSGLIEHALGHLDAAVAALHAAWTLRPDPHIALNLGAALSDAGQPVRAIDVLRRALNLPDAPKAKLLTNLGAALHEAERLDDAADALTQALAVDRHNRSARHNLARVEFERGRLDAARAAYTELARDRTDTAARFKLATLLPLIARDEAEITQARAHFVSAVNALRNAGVSVRDPLHEAADPPFYVSYHGRDDDVQLLGALAQTLRTACPALCHVAAHCQPDAPRPAPDARIRIGFVSAFFFEHSIGKTLRALIEGLPRARFDVHVLRIPPLVDDTLSRQLAACATTHTLSGDLALARTQIADLAFDVVCYPDLGTDALSGCLAHARLAPVQCTTWGHPTTSGIPSVDLYFSHADLEPEGSDARYSERLVRVAKGAVYPGYPSPPQDGIAPRRADLGVPEEVPLLVCPQSLFKLMPEFDATLAAILTGAPDAHLLVPEERHPGITDLIRTRWAASMPVDVLERIHFFGRRGLADYVALIGSADVMLDPFPVGGGVSSFDAFSTGIPIVTWPRRLMRGRFAYACYRLLEIDDAPCAHSADHYVELALGLLNDPSRRHALRATLRARVARLYDDTQGVAEWASALEAAVHAARTR